ncbi:NAD-dependent dihydropyrimidine dehydrogenase subunit PreA [Botrimarina mediterranea]|uniref:dihydrouracil dehydrogenase (NAD(+)) n=1 Tax=Botrimarina mediterranea TaxID=2528022 RepID=A0A518K8S6_9BACT|nr:NAD-dependent dihydropyrimidine dehydrogenase subunit PreA [Botrimarina mediterranea]QDV74177.1 NAD-dependent dihydropyrimidine dehydrogenase subunit PreA [Botrimarina mediterranea]QDV78808.1 NAD-dependent dihydropyrimidine dehydrogenase subunit PreA [Planctomycetes bacterium K2D]
MPTLATTVDGLKLPNPFVIGSGPPGTNGKVIGRAFDDGWGAVICKTVSLDASKVVNVQPRYGRLRSRETGEIYGWENIELISDRSFDTWIDEFKKLKDSHPDGVLIASIMEEYNKDAWQEIVGRCEEAGVDSFELNMSCPHGMPERRMGAAVGEDPVALEEVCRWVMAVATKPVWAKMTPNVTHIEDPARAAFRAGCQGVSAINTIRSVIGVDLDTLRPEPNVEGYTTPGGYSCQAVRPIALRMCMEISKVIEKDFPGRTLSGLGGVETGEDAAQFILLGSSTVQVCTGVMKFGYDCVGPMKDQLLAFMEKHKFETIDDFRGKSLPYFTTHSDLVKRQAEAREAKKAEADKKKMIKGDAEWSGDDFVDQSDALARG